MRAQRHTPRQLASTVGRGLHGSRLLLCVGLSALLLVAGCSESDQKAPRSRSLENRSSGADEAKKEERRIDRKPGEATAAAGDGSAIGHGTGSSPKAMPTSPAPNVVEILEAVEEAPPSPVMVPRPKPAPPRPSAAPRRSARQRGPTGGGSAMAREAEKKRPELRAEIVKAEPPADAPAFGSKGNKDVAEKGAFAFKTVTSKEQAAAVSDTKSSGNGLIGGLGGKRSNQPVDGLKGESLNDKDIEADKREKYKGLGKSGLKLDSNLSTTLDLGDVDVAELAIGLDNAVTDTGTAPAQETLGKRRNQGAQGYRRGTRGGENARGDVANMDDITIAKPLSQPNTSRLSWAKDRYKMPAKFLPSMFYFDPTYLGGNAATAERQRRLKEALPGNPFAAASVYAQNFDAPDDAGIALSVRLDRNHLERPGRVYLEVGLQGSRRFGWRRPPLDMVVVVDAPAWQSQRAKVEATLEQLMRRLGPQDRLGLAVTGFAKPMVQPLARLRVLRRALPESLDRANTAAKGYANLSATMKLAADALAEVALSEAAIPGTQTVLLLAGASDNASARAAEATAHNLTSTRAVFTSVVQMSGGSAPWWDVAAKGYGNFHRLQGNNVGAVVEAELSTLSRVVARLLRVNVRLGPNTKAIRVVGTRKLNEEEVRQVKAREVAIDTQLSRAQGVKADRGEDDDGVQTVIPYFYGGDAHVIVLELWVDKPGPVADVTLKYKDMVKLDNATARASVALGASPSAVTPDQLAVVKNLLGARIAEGLKAAATQVRRGDKAGALRSLQEVAELVPAGERVEAQMIQRFIADVRSHQAHNRERLAQALQMAGERKLGISLASAP